jgi:hypothetical protein
MSDSLADFPLEFEDLPQNTRKKSGGKDSKMSKTTVTEAPKASKKYAKTRGEHIKDILIAVLVAAVIAFIGGMHFANKHNAEMQNAVKQAQALAPVAEAKK